MGTTDVAEPPRPGLATLRWTLLAVVGTAEAAAVVLAWGLEPVLDTAFYAVFALTSGVAGVLISARHPRNPISWLFLAQALLQALLTDLADGWALRGSPHGWPLVEAADLLGQSTWYVGSAIFVWVFLLFPDGRFSDRRWAWVAWSSVAACAAVGAGWALGTDVGAMLVSGENRYAVPGFPAGPLFGTGMVVLAGTMLLSGVAVGRRLRRATGTERQQLKWIALAYGVSVIVLVVLGPIWLRVPAVQFTDPLVRAAIPLTACLAILRYRLYDIELVISRTVLYALVTAVLAAGFTLTILALGVLFGRGSPWPTAGATLAVALAFRPLRDVLQQRIDRRFDRNRHAALHQLRAFMADLRSGRRDPEDIEEVLRTITADPSFTLHFTPTTDTDTDGDRRVRVPVTRGGIMLGEVTTRAAEAQLAILPALLDEASLAVEMARLRAELRAQLDEVKRSRLRIVAAAEDERRRIERDLHDGAQQRLVTIGLELRNAQHELGTTSPPTVTRALDNAVTGLTETIDELREMAQGIRPGVLDDGLAVALRELAGRSQLDVTVDASSDRFPADLETAAFFIACEALTNTVKHARASAVHLRLAHVGDRLVVAVTDDGVGGAAPREGGGLLGVSDRVAAYGGRCTITSPRGAGTTLLAELPCES